MTPTVAWLTKRLERHDLLPAERKRLTNRLKMQKPRHPQARQVARGFYRADQWNKITRRRKLAQASKRRNRRG